MVNVTRIISVSIRMYDNSFMATVTLSVILIKGCSQIGPGPMDLLHSTPAWQGLAGFRRPQNNPFVRRIFADFGDRNIVLYDRGETGNLWLSRDFHTHKHVPSEDLDLSVTAARATSGTLLSVFVLRKQDGFHWKLYKSRIRKTFVESSTKAGCLSLKAL